MIKSQRLLLPVMSLLVSSYVSRIIRMTIIFVLVIHLQADAHGFSQTITIDKKNASLEEILVEINKQTGYLYSANNEVVKKAKRIDIQVNDATIEEALIICFKDQPLIYVVKDNMIIIKDAPTGSPEKLQMTETLINVQGRIVNEKEEPVNATITVKGTSTAVATNPNGEFLLIRISPRATLIITGVGIQPQEESVRSRTMINITVTSKITEIQDVHVQANTGYEQFNSVALPLAVNTLNNENINRLASLSVYDRLKYTGEMATVSDRLNLSDKNNLVLRGTGTLTPSLQNILIVVDDFIYYGDLDLLNPADIESITILKDAAATSIWGVRAANGVIVINTKKGRFNRPAKVEVNMSLTITARPDLYSLPLISSNDEVGFETLLFNDGYRIADTSLPYHPAFSALYEVMLKKQNGSISDIMANSLINGLKGHDLRDDFGKYFYQHPLTSQLYVNVHGGTNTNTYAFSAGFDKNEDELHASYNRLSLQWNNLYRVCRNLDLQTFASAIHTANKNGRPAFGSISNMPIYTRLADENGNALPFDIQYRGSFTDTAGAGALQSWKYYPLDDYKYVQSSANTSLLNFVAALNYKLPFSFSINVKYNFQQQSINQGTLYDQQSYFTRDLGNSFYQPNSSAQFPVPVGGILDRLQNTQTVQHFRSQLNYNKSGKDYSVTAFGGTEITEIIEKIFSIRNYGINSAFLTTGNAIDYGASYTLYNGNGDASIPKLEDSNKLTTRFVSAYVNGSYLYKERYSLFFSARRDASNVFGLATNDKWKPLWSVGAGWELSKERFYTVNALPYLRIRFTYGLSGNLDPGKVAVTTISQVGFNTLTQTNFSRIDKVVNPQLKWEQTAMLNFAIDFQLKNNIINGSFEYFGKNIENLYALAPVDGTAGIGQMITSNVGRVKGKGFEIRINTVNIDHTFNWKTNFIFNSYVDHITKLKELSKIGSEIAGDGLSLWENYSPYSYFAYRSAGLDPATGDPRGYLNGVASSDWNAITNQGSKQSDIRYIGRLMPVVSGAISNEFGWKNISCYVQVIYKFGYWFRRPSISYSALAKNLSGHSDYTLRWQQPGDELYTSVPSFVYPINESRDAFYALSETLATKGDHIRLQYINLSYDFDKKLIKKLSIESLKFYVIVNNVGILWRANKQHLDPDYADIPPGKSFTFGLRVSL
jgi:TonB-linked SusC/RagA family outer membrane protein